MESPKYIDIHTHTYIPVEDTILLLNVFPGNTEKLNLPVYKSVGLHPWKIEEKTWPKTRKIIEDSMKINSVIAIGETGLDKIIKMDYALQTRVFLSHLEIATLYRKPVIIHCVRSYSEMLAIRKKSDQSIPWIFHWYNSDEHIAFELIRKNCFLSFGHMLFKEDSKAYRTFVKLPVENIFFETDDAGYTIQEVYSMAASLRNCDLDGLLKQIINNFGRCFQL